MYEQADDVIMGLGTVPVKYRGYVPLVLGEIGPAEAFFAPRIECVPKSSREVKRKTASVGVAVQYCRKLHIYCLSSFTASAYRSYHGHVTYGPARTRQRLGGQCSASAPRTPNCRLYGHLPSVAVSPRLARTVQHRKLNFWVDSL